MMDYTKKIILYGLSMFKDNVIEMLSEKYGSFENAKEHILFFTDSNEKYWGDVYRGIDIKEPSEIFIIRTPLFAFYLINLMP